MQMIALPLVFGYHVGVAEAMRDRAIALVAKRAENPGLLDIVGEMDTELACARLAHRDMVEAAFTLEPGFDTSNRIFTNRTLVGRAVLRVGERAMPRPRARTVWFRSGRAAILPKCSSRS
jgi:hypothetical protein